MADWFRNKAWDAAIERAFTEKLRRARAKGQYLRIQASTLADSHPQVALKLLEQYFDLPEDFDRAQAHVASASAYLALGRVHDAIAAYDLALAREAVFPHLLTYAHLKLPYLVATHGLKDHYERAIALLDMHHNRLTFPVDHFIWHVSYALMTADMGELSGSSSHAAKALEAAAKDHSGFRYHPSVGLVTEQYDDLLKKVRTLRVA